MFFLKKLLSALILPPAGPILLALYGLWLARKHPRLGRAITLTALLGLLGLSLPLVQFGLHRQLQNSPPVSTPDLARAQAIVVLGGGIQAAPEYGRASVGHATLERVRYGAYLQKRSGLPILVTGGAPFGGRPEGDAMKEVIEGEFGGQVRWNENASRDTAENAVFSARLLKAAGITRVVLISHGWHLPRSVPLFERQGLEVIPAPTGYAARSSSLAVELLPSANALKASVTVLHEWLGIFVQRLTQ